MKPYLIAKIKIAQKMSLMPNTINFDTLEWKKFIVFLVDDDPNTAAGLIKTRCPEYCSFLNKKYPNISKLGEKVYLHSMNNELKIKCKCCENNVVFSNIATGYRKYCSIKCKNIDPETKQRIKNTCIERFGVSSPFKSKACQEKAAATNLQKYGHSNVFGSSDIKEKIKKICIIKYGTANPSQSTIIKDKIKQTCKIKYGVDYITQSDIFKARSRKTCLERYGVENAMQNFDTMMKGMKTAKRLKNLTLPSGKIIQYQGYENVVIDFLLEQIKEADLKFFKDVPNFRYGKTSRIYFPDLFITSTNTIIEVKSTWTLSTEEQYLEISEKSKAVIKQGYNFKLFLCSKTKILKIYNGVIDGRTATEEEKED